MWPRVHLEGFLREIEKMTRNQKVGKTIALLEQSEF